MPKVTTPLLLECQQHTHPPDPILSNSLRYHLHNVLCQFDLDTGSPALEQCSQVINPLEFVFSKVPSSKHAVSKLKPLSNVFYDLIEIAHTLNLLDMFTHRSMKTKHVSPHATSSVDCFYLMREYQLDTHATLPRGQVAWQGCQGCVGRGMGEKAYCLLCGSKNDADFFFFELEADEYKDVNAYARGLVQGCLLLLHNQAANGFAVIKIEEIYFKPVVDILYLLSHWYEKVFLFKPNTSNVGSSEKYLVCKKFMTFEKHRTRDPLALLLDYQRQMRGVLGEMDAAAAATATATAEQLHVHSLLQSEILYYFHIKLEEYNLILGHQQLTALDQWLHLMKNKNKEEKIETLKKMHIQKCVSWCEKYKVPNHKFPNQANLFLPQLPLIVIEKEEVDLGELGEVTEELQG